MARVTYFGEEWVVLLFVIVPFPGSATLFPRDASFTISAHGDSLSSCSGVSGNRSFAYLSYREALWHEFLQPRYGDHRVTFVGARRGCNRDVDALFSNATRFPNIHDAYFGRTAAAMRRDWRATSGGAIGALQPIIAGDVALLLVGSNDFLLKGKANASEVASVIVSLVDDLHSNRNSGGVPTTKLVLVGIPPTIDEFRVKLSPKRAIRWESYRTELHEHLNTACRQRLNVCRSVKDTSDADNQVWSLVVFDEWLPLRHTYDGLHPNKEGERVLARRWFRAMQPTLDMWLARADEHALKNRGVINLVAENRLACRAIYEERDGSADKQNQTMPWASSTLDGSHDTLWVSLAVLLFVVVGARCRRRRPVGVM